MIDKQTEERAKKLQTSTKHIVKDIEELLHDFYGETHVVVLLQSLNIVIGKILMQVEELNGNEDQA